VRLAAAADATGRIGGADAERVSDGHDGQVVAVGLARRMLDGSLDVMPPPPVPQAEAVGPFAATLAAWQEARQKVYGRAYVAAAKEKSQLGRLLASLKPADVAALPAAFARYLADQDPFLLKMGHTLTYFCTGGRVNLYLGGAPTQVSRFKAL
jgi:hypothetical protein